MVLISYKFLTKPKFTNEKHKKETTKLICYKDNQPLNEIKKSTKPSSKGEATTPEIDKTC